VLTTAYMNARQFDKALIQAHRSFDLDPNFPLARLWLGLAYVANGKYDEAIGLNNDVPVQSPTRWVSLYVTAYAHARAGHKAEAEKLVAEIREIGKTQYIRPYYLACVYAALGDKDKAFAQLGQSLDEKDCYAPRARIDPALDPLRDDPRFAAMMKRMNMSE